MATWTQDAFFVAIPASSPRIDKFLKLCTIMEEAENPHWDENLYTTKQLISCNGGTVYCLRGRTRTDTGAQHVIRQFKGGANYGASTFARIRSGRSATVTGLSEAEFNSLRSDMTLIVDPQEEDYPGEGPLFLRWLAASGYTPDVGE